MDIQSEITKKVFEQHVPAAKMPERNTSVYDRLSAMFVISYRKVVENIVSPLYIDNAEADKTVKQHIIRVVCLDAFVRSCRSLDLVLTATGFGIVSTESMAPASKARVDALIEEINIEELIAIDAIVEWMRNVDGWALTPQAEIRIKTFFFSPQHLQLLTSMQLTWLNWQKAQSVAMEAQCHLRNTISSEYLKALMERYRSNTCTEADKIIVNKALVFYGAFISQSEGRQPGSQIPNWARTHLDNIMDVLESHVDDYPEYKTSKLYEKRHRKRYENKQDDPTFFFV